MGGAVASGAANTGVNPIKMGGVFNTTQPTVSNGQVVDAQLTPRGAQIVNVGVEGFLSPTGDAATASAVISGGNYLFNGSTWDRQRSASGTTGIATVETESVKTTYSAVAANIALASGGVVVLLQGSATKTIRLKRAEVSGTLTTASAADVLILRYSSGPTGGTTTTAPTIVSHDGNDAAATAVISAYSTPPNGGLTAIGALRERRIFLSTPTTLGSIAEWQFGDKNDKAAILRGIGQYYGLALSNASAYTGASINLMLEWTEE
jgi:hypothetical protein